MAAGYGEATQVDGDAEGFRPVAFPPVVYVPCAPIRDADSELVVDLRRTRDGRMALLVYSALDRLVGCCGPAQPWTLVASTSLEELRLATGFELVLMDLDIPDEYRYTGAAA
ncbi:SAV_915 family protein [Actinoplanes sp. M2I2]|uniref:SAV_915 family protein n=1 Tax=Actinoplanes sp. M2I2 TaxID=1734444 RepID=UPI0020223561|nr:SAV_915 family protein [Actinoplanes sp. M2I2]